VYPALWALTEALPRYGKQRDVTISDLLELIENLRGWYFERGGLFLSPDSRDAYFAFQTALAKATRGHEPYETIDPATREQLRESGSSLRTTLRWRDAASGSPTFASSSRVGNTAGAACGGKLLRPKRTCPKATTAGARLPAHC
jgi:hypothetical protein